MWQGKSSDGLKEASKEHVGSGGGKAGAALGSADAVACMCGVCICVCGVVVMMPHCALFLLARQPGKQDLCPPLHYRPAVRRRTKRAAAPQLMPAPTLPTRIHHRAPATPVSHALALPYSLYVNHKSSQQPTATSNASNHANRLGHTRPPSLYTLPLPLP